MRAARSTFQTNSAADIAGRQTASEAAIGNILFDLFYLQSRGVKNVLLANLPDLGGAPEAVALGLQAASTDANCASMRSSRPCRPSARRAWG